MTDNPQHPRLDEILVREGLVSEEQVREALLRQKAHGGKLGSQLLYHRHIDEAGLVKALTLQFDCEGVILSNLNIPEHVVAMIPERVVLAREVIPFDYDPENNILKIACENPSDKSLIDELNFVGAGKQIKLFVAAELALKTAIAKYYQGADVSLDDNLLLDIPDCATDTGKVPIVATPDASPQEGLSAKHVILLVTDEEYSGPLLKSLLERDNFQVIMTDSADDAIDFIGNRTFHTVLIKDTVSGDYLDLIDRLRKTSPRTVVRYYESASVLLINQETIATEGDLLLKNLDLFSSLLAFKGKLPDNHSGAVGQYVDKLCRKLGLPNKDRLLIANAAYLHNLALFYYRMDENQDQRLMISRTAKLLSSLNYSPLVVEILKSMYKDLKGRFTKRLPIEALGGNILTIVDLFCDSFPSNEKLSLNKFDVIKKKIRDLTGKLFLGEVVEAFIGMIQDEILQTQTNEKHSQIMIFTDEPGPLCTIEMRLKNEGFRIVSQSSVESFASLFSRSQPDIVILLIHGDKDQVTDMAGQFIAHEVDFDQVPTFLLVDGASSSELTELLDRGVEDIMALNVNLDMLITKLRKIDDRIQGEKEKNVEMTESPTGTRGRLTDINLIDLLQALGPARKTCQLTVTLSGSDSGKLIIYLNKGVIVHAQLGDIPGAEAVYEGIGWTYGSWLVEQITPDDLPAPNNTLPNESILMEGCRLLDEKVRGGQLL